LIAALDAVTAAPGAVLVVYSLSRLARSVRDTLQISERLEAGGADLVSLSESIDTTSATGKMVFRLLAVLAEFERDLLSERTRGAFAHKRSKNERLGQIPFGKLLAADGRTLVDDPDAPALAARVRSLRADGWSLRRIAAALDEQAVPTKSGGPSWSHTSVRRLLLLEPTPS
jgi:DNA invertase Pin-like site-specific DNA recombinase